MEYQEIIPFMVHHGQNIKNTRREKNMNQDVLAELTHLSQQTVSRYESMRVIDDEMLERFAKALGVTVEELKTRDENQGGNIIIDKIENGNVSNTGDNTMNPIQNFNPIDKITELYERIIEDKDKQISSLEERIRILEKTNL